MGHHPSNIKVFWHLCGNNSSLIPLGRGTFSSRVRYGLCAPYLLQSFQLSIQSLNIFKIIFPNYFTICNSWSFLLKIKKIVNVFVCLFGFKEIKRKVRNMEGRKKDKGAKVTTKMVNYIIIIIADQKTILVASRNLVSHSCTSIVTEFH